MALTKFKCKCIPIVIQQPVIKAWWKVAWQKQGSYFFEFLKFLDFPWLFPCPFLLFDDHRFSCHFLKLWKLLVTCFSIFLALKQFNRNKLWYPPKCVLFALFNYSSLSYVILALSSAVTNLPYKGENFNFPWLSRPWKWNSYIRWLSRFPMTCTNPEKAVKTKPVFNFVNEHNKTAKLKSNYFRS